MSYFLIKSHGQRVIYLGQDVPYENLASTIDVVQPANVLTFFRTGNAPEERSEFLEHILTQFGDRNVYIATDPSRIPENAPDNVNFLHTIDHLVELF